MILSFSRLIDKKETLFREKILLMLATKNDNFDYFELTKPNGDILKLYPKKHTIREDKNNRWKAGNSIQFYEGSPRNGGIKFHPDVMCRSVQRISIFHYPDECKRVLIDGTDFYRNYFFKEEQKDSQVLEKMERKMEVLAKNDGFDSIEDFFNYFNTDFTGKIIHWTNLTY